MTVTVTEAGPASAAEWDGFVASADAASVYHRWLWRDLVAAEFGAETHYLMARDAGGKVCGVLPLVRLRSLLFGDFMVSVPFFNYGGCLSATPAADAKLMAAAADRARQLGVSHVEYRETRPREGMPVRTDKVAMILALSDSGEAQWRALGSKLRAQVKRPEKEGITVSFGGAELLDAFYRVFARNMRDLGTPVYGRSFFARIIRALPDVAEIAVATAGEVPVAAGLTLRHGQVTEIPWASSLREWNRTGANMLLYWRILERAIATGSREFDFGRSTADSGTFRFKAQWGARPRQLHWHYWLREGQPVPGLNPDNPRFALAIRAWRRLPLGIANRLGPRIVRWLP